MTMSDYFYYGHGYTRQRAQGHRTYEVGIAKPEVRLLLSLQALAVLVSDILRKEVFRIKELHLVSKLKPFSLWALLREYRF